MNYTDMDVINGECRDNTTPRTAEEVYAVRILNIPAEMVRQWVLTLEQYEKGIKLPKEVKTEQSDTVTSDDLSLEELHKIFEEKEGKKVPINKKNDSEWIKTKIFN